MPSPASGSGLHHVFTFTYSDPLGYTNLGVLNGLFRYDLDAHQACYFAYAQPSHVFYLIDDTGLGLSAPIALGTSGTVSNSQC